MNQDNKLSLFQEDQSKIRQYAMEIVNEATTLISKEQIRSLLISKHNVYQHLFYDDSMLLSKIKINIKYKLFDIPYFHKLRLDTSGKIYSTQQSKISKYSPTLSDLDDDDSSTSFFKNRSVEMKNDHSSYADLRNKYKKNKSSYPLEQIGRAHV